LNIFHIRAALDSWPAAECYKNKTGTNAMAQPRAPFSPSRFAGAEAGLSFALGLPRIDGVLGGGLALHALHEIAPSAPSHAGAALGWALILAGQALRRRRARAEILLVQQDFAALESGALYGAGLSAFGLAPARVLLVRAARPLDALWTMEEGLRCAGFAAVIGEIGQSQEADLTATRRLSLSAQAGEGLGLLLRPRPDPNASACVTRWEVAAAPGTGDRFGGLGRIGFALNLTKNKRGPTGAWDVEWDVYERGFASADSLPVAAPSSGRPHRQSRAASGFRAVSG